MTACKLTRKKIDELIKAELLWTGGRTNTASSIVAIYAHAMMTWTQLGMACMRSTGADTGINGLYLNAQNPVKYGICH